MTRTTFQVSFKVIPMVSHARAGILWRGLYADRALDSKDHKLPSGYQRQCRRLTCKYQDVFEGEMGAEERKDTTSTEPTCRRHRGNAPLPQPSAARLSPLAAGPG